MKLVCLGAGGYHPSDVRHTACYMLPELGIVLDAGTGFYRVRGRVQTPRLDVFLSHGHLDHTFGLTCMFNVVTPQQMSGVTVYGLPEKISELQTHLFHPTLFPVAAPFAWKAIEQGQAVAGGGKLTHFPLEHPGGAIGMRFDWPGKSLAYVTDTVARGAQSAYLPHIQGVDLLIHECYFADGPDEWAAKIGHSVASPVAQVAKLAGAKRLLLIHVDPTNREEDPIGIETVRGIFPHSELARDLQVIDF